MSTNFPIVSLADAGVKLIDCVHKTPEAVSEGYPYVAIPQMVEGRLDLKSAKLISEEDLHEWNVKCDPREGDVVLSRRCNPGVTAVIPHGFKGALGQNLVLLRAEGVKIDPGYLRWVTRGREWWNEVDRFINVGAIFESLRCADIPRFSIPLPTLTEQKAIAHILGTLDDKIELNRKTNETLEAMAKALFKSWFVDFDPVRAKAESRTTGLPSEIIDLFPDSFEDSELGEVPKGWQQRELQEIGLVIDPHPSHRAPKETTEGFPFAGIGDIDEMGNINRSKARVVDEESVLEQESCYEINHCSSGFGRVGTVGKVVRLRKQSFRYAISPTLAIVNPVKSCYAGLCYLLLGSPGFQAKVRGRMTGSTRPAIGIQILRKIPTLLPPESSREIYNCFESSVRVLIERGDLLNAQTCSLIQARDVLLPKLISGELRIPDVEKLLEEVGI